MGVAARRRRWVIALVPAVLVAGCTGSLPPEAFAPSEAAVPVAMSAVPMFRTDVPLHTADNRLHADVLALDADIAAWFEQRIEGGDPRERMGQLVRLFQSQQLGLRYSAALTTTASETFRRREGNCLSLSALFVAVARHIGLVAGFQDVELMPSWRQEGDVFVVERHINAVVQIDGEPLVVDFLVRQDGAASRVTAVADAVMEAQFFNNVGVEHLAAGDHAAAYLFSRRGIAAAADIAYLWSNLGVALARNGQRDEAERAYRMALRLDGEDAVALSNLALLLDGDSDMAQSLMARVQRLRDSNPYYHYWEAERLRRQGDGRAAMRALQAALALKPGEGSFQLALARLYLQQGAPRQAQRSFATALRLAPDQPSRARYQALYRSWQLAPGDAADGGVEP